MEKVGIAVVGPGRIATAHLEAIRKAEDLVDLIAVVGLPDEHNRTLELASRYRAGRASNDLDEVLADDRVEAVILTVPNHLHASIAITALERGKHVLVEKPLANTAVEAQSIRQAALAAERTVMVAQCRRFFAGTREAKARVREFGGPITILHTLGVWAESVATAWWRSADDTGGLALGLNGPHVVDTMLWLADSPVTTVYAQGRRLRDLWEGEDEAVLTLSFADGSLGMGYLSLNTRPGVNTRLVTAAGGSLLLEDDRRLWADGELVVDEPTRPYIEGDSSFDGQLHEFVSAIRAGRRPESNIDDGIAVVRVLEAARESAATGLPIRL